ncbi:hypothetical protein DFH09DRAFT_1277476 [Mycena vulgaris]|nr:hypothetical protein DFH09DRAFT_1277476 [Mycena vulgaris]
MNNTRPSSREFTFRLGRMACACAEWLVNVRTGLLKCKMTWDSAEWLVTLPNGLKLGPLHLQEENDRATSYVIYLRISKASPVRNERVMAVGSALLQLLAVQNKLDEPLNLNGDLLADLRDRSVVACPTGGIQGFNTMFSAILLASTKSGVLVKHMLKFNRAHALYDKEFRPPDRRGDDGVDEERLGKRVKINPGGTVKNGKEEPISVDSSCTRVKQVGLPTVPVFTGMTGAVNGLGTSEEFNIYRAWTARSFNGGTSPYSPRFSGPANRRSELLLLVAYHIHSATGRQIRLARARESLRCWVKEGWEIVQVEGNQLFQEFRVKFRGEERSQLKSSSNACVRPVIAKHAVVATTRSRCHNRFAASQGGAAAELLIDRCSLMDTWLLPLHNTPPSSLARSLKFSWNFGLIELEFRQTIVQRDQDLSYTATQSSQNLSRVVELEWGSELKCFNSSDSLKFGKNGTRKGFLRLPPGFYPSRSTGIELGCHISRTLAPYRKFAADDRLVAVSYRLGVKELQKTAASAGHDGERSAEAVDDEEMHGTSNRYSRKLGSETLRPRRGLCYAILAMQ